MSKEKKFIEVLGTLKLKKLFSQALQLNSGTQSLIVELVYWTVQILNFKMESFKEFEIHQIPSTVRHYYPVNSLHRFGVHCKLSD